MTRISMSNDKNFNEQQQEDNETSQIPVALNHVSWLCKSVQASVDFYVRVLGFVLINRPPYLNFDGAWLFNYGVGVHLVQKKDGGRVVSIQCEDMDAVEQKLKEMNINYMKRTINEEEGATIDQLFFNNPDGFMVELCNCKNLELVM